MTALALSGRWILNLPSKTMGRHVRLRVKSATNASFQNRSHAAIAALVIKVAQTK